LLDNGAEDDNTQMSIEEQDYERRFEPPDPQGFDLVFAHAMGVVQRNSKNGMYFFSSIRIL
jgi:hypothetical protein